MTHSGGNLGVSAVPGSRVVDVKIAQLRKWLESGDNGGPIHTVHGLGYRVDAKS